MRVVVFKVPLQELEEKCYTVTDAVEWCVHLPQDGFKEAPTTALYEFVNYLDTAGKWRCKTVNLERGYKT